MLLAEREHTLSVLFFCCTSVNVSNDLSYEDLHLHNENLIKAVQFHLECNWNKGDLLHLNNCLFHPFLNTHLFWVDLRLKLLSPDIVSEYIIIAKMCNQLCADTSDMLIYYNNITILLNNC